MVTDIKLRLAFSTRLINGYDIVGWTNLATFIAVVPFV
jgi:hypothetical protein